MSSLLQNTIFGNNKYKANTFIGGVSATLNTPALIAAKLGLPITRIKSFAVVQDDIQFAVIGGNYSIPLNAFTGRTDITYYYDNNGLVISIGSSAFSDCVNLFGAKFKNWQSTGGHAAFKSCSSLNITDFSALKSITHHSTFLNCSALLASSFNWNAFTTISGDSTFQGCISFIGSITLNMSGTLGINVFKGTKINSFTANNITSIQYGAFSLCSNLLTFQTDSVVTINSINTNFQTFESVPCVSYSFPALKTLGESTFKFNSFVQSFSAPELTNLEAQAFSQSVNLNYCNIPKVINLGNSAFNGCKSLPSFSDSHFDNVLVVSDSLFAFCSNALFTRICFNNATSALATPFNGATNLSYIAIPKLKTTSNNFLFSNANVSTLIIPLVESLGSGFLNGFSGISALSIIDIPKCTTFTGGLSSVNKNMFARAKIGVVINVNIAMQTNNDGAPDFDLTWAITNKSAIVNYIT